MGEVSTVADTTIANYLTAQSGSDTGVNTHLFRYYTADQYFTPWLTIHNRKPHDTAANQLGEIFQDGKVRTLTLTAAAGAPVTCDLDLLARLYQSDYVFDFDPSTWAAAAYDDFDSFGVTSCDGHFQVEGTSFQVTNVSLTFANNPLAPGQSIRIGTTHPMDFPTLSRTVQVTATILVEDYNLYVSTFEGTANAGVDANVGCAVYKADLDVMFASQNYITGTTPYRIRIISSTADDNVAWQVRPLRIQPNRPVVLQVTSNLLAVGSGDPIRIYLQNDLSSYAMP